MRTHSYLSWENFRSTVFIAGQQRIHRVSSRPRIEVFGDGIANRVGLVIATPPGTTVPEEVSRLAFIKSRIVNLEGSYVIEVSTGLPSLHRHFYHFAIAVAERALVERRTAVEAIVLELQCFEDLLEEKPLLGFERQIGLLGELIFLERLVKKSGVNALDAWLGPVKEPHDFRLGQREFEVKATVSPHRVHTVNGTEQLVASEGCSLYLASVMLGPPGTSEGFSLARKAEDLADMFANTSGRLPQFRAALEASGYRAEDSAHYTRRFVFRRPIGLVPVDDNFPAITRPTIQQALGLLAPRIDALRYDVNVDGLEREDGVADFEALIQS